MANRKLKRRQSKSADLANEVVKSTRKKKTKKKPVDWISSGATILNLASSQLGRGGGFPRERIIRIVGDGSAGKTLLAVEVCAQAVYNMVGNKSHNFPIVKKVEVVYNNTEGVMDFPIEEMYGKKFVKTVKFIRKSSVEATGRDLTRRLKKIEPGTFFIYVIDSWDFIKSEKEIDAFEESVRKDEESSSGFGQNKPAYTTQKFFPNVARNMEGKDVLIIIVAQTRDNIGVTFGPKKRVGGGGAFNFYTHQELWLREIRKLHKKVKGHKVTYGIDVSVMFKRNKVSLPYREANFTIYFDYGIDDIGSMLDWHFGPDKSNKLTKKNVDSLGFSVKIKKPKKKGAKFTKAKVVKHIEKNDLEDELREFIEGAWAAVEKGGKTTDRKKRFE